ncbi:Pimeloyl-ACP methyl ester carboxylesterase [Ferrimonas sediminum]|uniref:Proline iminopeptidase n=1 Tax=Ferrimonas sediminum TaxID=718193 RepID=A0A1G8U8I7_9GAMM|nr:alpha/beta fold hydrolase [Ferrimonas sediminum]SDJ50136.1 Pimeloyl-ACP methyl ester carboxylesterase [Ferrimonas sediminum]
MTATTRPSINALRGVFCLLLLGSLWGPGARAASLSPCYLNGLSEQVECGVLSVPEDYNEPDKTRIPIHFARIAAIKSSPGKAPLLVITGGPGQSALDDADLFEQVFARIRQSRDLILIDQRGTGRSNPLLCDEDTSVAPLAQDDSKLDLAALIQQCLSQQQADVSQYHSRHALEDFELVRQALGITRWHLYGISYGTRMAQLYMRHHPDALETVTLDGVVPMQQSVLTIGYAVNRALDQLLRECLDSPDCHRSFPSLSADLANVQRRLQAKPVTLSVTDPLSAQPATFVVTRNKFLSALRMALYSPTSRSLIPLVIHAAARNNFQPLLGMQQTESNFGIAMGMHLSVICQEDWPRVSAQQKQQLKHSSAFAANMVDLFQRACPVWGTAEPEAAFSQAIDSDIPTLLLSGEKDPATPPSWGVLAQAGLRNSSHLIAPHATHGVAFQTCAPRLIQQLIETGSPQELDSECLSLDTHRAFYLNANSVESPREATE